MLTLDVSFKLKIKQLPLFTPIELVLLTFLSSRCNIQTHLSYEKY